MLTFSEEELWDPYHPESDIHAFDSISVLGGAPNQPF